MNASMNDTHNLGNELKIFEVSCTLIDSVQHGNSLRS
jgi:hypothetical protein